MGVALERARVERVKLVPGVPDPVGVFVGEEAAAGGEQRSLAGAPGAVPVVLCERGFGAVDGLSGVLEVDERVGREVQTQLGAAMEHVLGEQAPQL